MVIATAITYSLIESGHTALFVRTNDLVQRLQVARRDLALPALLTFRGHRQDWTEDWAQA